MKLKLLFLIATTLCSLTLAQAQNTFEVFLDGAQEVPPNSSPGLGIAGFYLSGTQLVTTNASYLDLLGGATSVTLNDGPPGSNAPVVVNLILQTPGSTSGDFYGSSGALSTAQLADLRAGSFYVNIRSSVFPVGEIRGQIVPVPEPATLALAGLGALTWLLKNRARR